jgi:hypothetical protein
MSVYCTYKKEGGREEKKEWGRTTKKHSGQAARGNSQGKEEEEEGEEATAHK